MMDDIKQFNILEFKPDKITFSTLEEMEGAYCELHNGRDIYLILGDEVIYLRYQDISSKLYDGRIQFVAKLTEKKNPMKGGG